MSSSPFLSWSKIKSYLNRLWVALRGATSIVAAQLQVEGAEQIEIQFKKT